MLHPALPFFSFLPSRFLSVYLSPVRLFLYPHFVSLTPSPSPAQFCPLCLSPFSVMFPILELRICQTSHFFLHWLVSVFSFPSLLFSYSPTLDGISFLTCLCVHSLPPPPSPFHCPFLLKSHRGSFEGPERRPWRGARRGRVWPPTLQHSIVLH